MPGLAKNDPVAVAVAAAAGMAAAAAEIAVVAGALKGRIEWRLQQVRECLWRE